jgi:uncharacterized Zn finger protein (UPF0148 family)
MKCANCQHESKEDFKHCPECGVKVSATETEQEEARRLLKETHAAITTFTKRLDDAAKKRKEKEDEKAKLASTPSRKSKGILDLF